LFSRIDVALAFHILADAAKTNIDILETIQLLAQAEPTAQIPLHKRADSNLLSFGWRAWSWQMIVLLCECLTSICISTEQPLIKRTVLFGSEISSENIMVYASNMSYTFNEQKTITDSSTTHGNEDNVCLMQMIKYRSLDEKGKVQTNEDKNDSAWRVRYISLLCMSQIYKHLKNEPRHRTLSNLLWLFINEIERNERDDRVLEALKVGRVRKMIFPTRFRIFILSMMMILYKH